MLYICQENIHILPFDRIFPGMGQEPYTSPKRLLYVNVHFRTRQFFQDQGKQGIAQRRTVVRRTRNSAG